VSLGCATAELAGAARYHVTIRRTAHGIPHILAGDYGSLGYGFGFAAAQDNICVLADVYTTVRAERSRYFGPSGSYAFRGNGTNPNNLNSDFFFQRIIDERTVEKLIAEPPPRGPVPQVKQAVAGYVAGYNAYLRSIGGPAGIKDPACKGKPWVHPLQLIDAYRRFYQLALMASSAVAIDGIGSAQPLLGGASSAAAAARLQNAALARIEPGRLDELLGGIGSNAVALGSAATDNGRGMLLGNPHFPWDGAERFYQAHATIPGKFDVSGGALLGTPVVNIGFTRGLAWSHTVSTARRFTIFELHLAPGDPTSYVVDGRTEKMRARRVTVRLADGSSRSRTLYESRYGPMITAILGLPVFPWSPLIAYSMGDANATNFRYLNHFFFVNRAQSVPQLRAILKKYLGIPWVNTIAADSKGRAYYADIGSVPGVSAAKIANCSAALGVATNRLLRVQVLDGSRGACDWDSSPDAIAPKILPPSAQPELERDDYVTNSNDSYWLSNPLHPLEGFSPVIGDERTARSPRTRLGLRIVQQRLDGSDGLPGRRFTLRQLQDAVFNDRQYLGELWRDQLVAYCRANPMVLGQSGFVDVSGACPVLAAWDLHDNLDSKGAILFRRFATRVTAAPLPVGPTLPIAPVVSPFAVPFSAADPVNTPRGLNSSDPAVGIALADAVTDLRRAGIPLDAPLRGYQYEKRGDEAIPIHGGPGTVGVFNAINVTWDAKRGYPNVPHGSSYVQVVQLTGGCPRAHTILTYSESADPTSPWFADQTRLFSRKKWVNQPFCERDVARAKKVSVTKLGGGYRARR
jgi:acyl-homoserine-lactone acylase